MKKFILPLLLLCAFLGIKASAQTLEVSLPQYQITVNGQTINNNASEYPFLEYKNILYFPLTYNMCEFVGLETHFAQKGYTPNSPYLFYVGKSQKSNSNYAENPSSGGAQSKTAEILSLGNQKAPGLYGDNYTEHVPLFDGRYFVIICTAKEGHVILKVDMLAGVMVYANKI